MNRLPAQELADKLIVEFPELSSNKKKITRIITNHIKSELKRVDNAVDRLILQSEFGNYKAILKVIRLLTTRNDLGIDEEPEKSSDFP